MDSRHEFVDVLSTRTVMGTLLPLPSSFPKEIMSEATSKERNATDVSQKTKHVVDCHRDACSAMEEFIAVSGIFP